MGRRQTSGLCSRASRAAVRGGGWRWCGLEAVRHEPLALLQRLTSSEKVLGLLQQQNRSMQKGASAVVQWPWVCQSGAFRTQRSGHSVSKVVRRAAHPSCGEVGPRDGAQGQPRVRQMGWEDRGA